MAELIRLLYGRDRRNPIRWFDLSEASTGNLHLAFSGFAPGGGNVVVNYSGSNPRNDGEERVNSYRNNAVLTIAYNMNGSSKAELASLQAEIDRFFVECGLYEEDRRGEPVWLQYRWDDNLTALREPVYGQLSQYYRVLQGDIPNWPTSLYTAPFEANYIMGVACTLICKPFPLGLPQLAATGKGQLEITDDGILVAAGVTNLFTNPSFGHVTDFDNDWTASNALLLVAQETRPTFTKYLSRGVRLTNTDISTDRTFTQTLTLTAVDYVCSWYLKKEDSSAVTSADVEIVIQATARTTSFISLGDGWYLAYAAATAAASSSTHGLEVKAGKRVFAAATQLEIASGNPYTTNNKPSAFCAGHLIGCSWLGTAHDSSSSRPDPLYSLLLENEFTGLYSFSFWATFYWNNTWPSADVLMYRYRLDGNNVIQVYYSVASSAFIIFHLRGGVTVSGTTSTQTFDYGDSIHFCVVQAASTCYLYINGVEAKTISVAAVYPADGTLYIGTNHSSNSSAATSFDGIKIWDNALSATEVAALYANEYEVKANSKTTGTAPVFWTKDGDAGIDAVDGVVSTAAKDDWGMLVGVPGTEPALTEIHLDPPTTTPPYVYWVGRLEADEPFTPAGTIWLDYSGTADAGASSGDAYETDTTTGSGTDTHDFDATIDESRVLRGHFQVIGRFKVTGASIDTQPWWKDGSSGAVLWDTVTITANANFLLQNFKDITIDWGDSLDPPTTMTAGLLCTETEATATTVALDFLCLLPYPYARVEIAESSSPSFAAGDTLVVTSDRTAWVMDASDNDSQLYHCHFEGEPITVIPHKYNYMIFLLGADGAQYDVTDALTNIKIYVTPRWRLPGQAVG